MKKLLFLIVISVLAVGVAQEQGISIPGLSLTGNSTDSVLRSAYNDRKTDLQVQGQGTVIKLLADDLDGSRHQRFILKLGSGQTLLVAHNIDLAPRISGLQIGDTVEFYGEYEWNAKGGVIHWTHHDPGNRHVAGWLKHGGRTYQ